jgi:L-threonylcarbamoyladenylate synthase
MKAEILRPGKETFKKSAEIIKRGGLVAFPTETVYGLGADAFNPKAVAKIFDIKNRPRFDPLIVHIADFKDVELLAQKIDRKAKLLMDKFWPGPLTLVLPKSDIVPDIVTAGLETVAIRMPSHPVALEFIKMTGVPIAAPSANPFGYLSPTEAIHVAKQIGDKIDLIIDGGRCPVGIESTVLEISKEPIVLRLGGLPIEEIEKVRGKVKISTLSKKPRSPGQLPHHYSPRIPLKIIKGEIDLPKGIKAGLLAFKNSKYDIPFKKIEILSPKGDLIEAASNFFSCLHNLDTAYLDIIYAEPVPEIGLGRAIMDRLCKAEGIKNG